MADNINVPSGFGGIVRYNEEYNSRFMLKPTHVIAFAVLIILLVIGLRMLIPLSV